MRNAPLELVRDELAPTVAVNRSRCICGVLPGERHDSGCVVPLAIIEYHPELWELREDAQPHPTDDTLERCNRGALFDWVRNGRPL